MGWWPFSKRENIPDAIRKDTRSRLKELQEICERHHQMPEAARIRIRELMAEWDDSGDQEDELKGLRMRANRLLRADDSEFIELLDNLEFWKPGWRP